MRNLFLLLCVATLAGCAHHQDVAPVDFAPLDQHLAALASLNNRGQYEAMRSYFAQGAMIQMPATPQSASVDTYLHAIAVEPSTMNFSDTEIIYSMSGRAATRSTVAVNAPGRYNVRERATVDWVLEDGYWRIKRIAVTDWPSIVGTWRRSGLRDEGSIELRVLPGGTYAVYLNDDYTLPAYRGHYTLEGNKITFADIAAAEAKNFQDASGSYIFVRTATGVTLTKVDEDNTWRADRYEGAWAGAR